MPTAQDYFDSFDKEAIVLNHMARIGTNAIARSGSKVGRLPNNFGVAVPKVKPSVGIKTEPFSPIAKNDIAKPKNWVTEPFKKHKIAGSPGNPFQGAGPVSSPAIRI